MVPNQKIWLEDMELIQDSCTWFEKEYGKQLDVKDCNQPDQPTCLHIANPLVSAHDKEVNPVKDLFLLSAEKQLATLGAVDHHNDVVLLAEAGNGLQREDSSTLA